MTDFMWISNEGEEEADGEGPMFYVGDKVVLFNPYTEEIFVREDDFAPPKFEILETRYDEEDEVYRYRLDTALQNEWYSEDWISLPMATDFVKYDLPITHKEVDEMIASSLREQEIDRLLEIVRYGTQEEKKAAEEALKKLSEEDDLKGGR